MLNSSENCSHQHSSSQIFVATHHERLLLASVIRSARLDLVGRVGVNEAMTDILQKILVNINTQRVARTGTFGIDKKLLGKSPKTE